jgi:catechol 2,3-dioxygenase-like lactoylglutathione lyase family enzyme
MSAQLQYIALRSDRPEELADFYREHFLLEDLGRSENGDIALTDGYFNLSIFNGPTDPRPIQPLARPERNIGFSHIGIHVDDLREFMMQLEEHGGMFKRLVAEEESPCRGEFRVLDPNGLAVSISTNHFGVTTSAGERRLPGIRHVALSVPNNDVVVDYYSDVFGFRATDAARDKNSGNPSRGTGDGNTAFQILVYPVTTSDVDPGVTLGPRHTRWGLNHFGWLVSDLEKALETLPEGSTSPRPASRGMAEWRGQDPDGNEFDLSQAKGYLVDVDTWVKA